MMFEESNTLRYYVKTYFESTFFQVMSNPAKVLPFIARAVEL